jgi:hypothetical protein
MSRYTGRCACGAIAAAIDGEALVVRQCWCRQCQKIAAGSPTTNAMFATEALAIEGDLSSNSYVAASGNVLTQHFCGQCGTPVMGGSSARPQFRVIRLGFLDLPNDLAPSAAIWTEDAPEWACIDPALEVFARQAPPPQPKP